MSSDRVALPETHVVHWTNGCGYKGLLVVNGVRMCTTREEEVTCPKCKAQVEKMRSAMSRESGREGSHAREQREMRELYEEIRGDPQLTKWAKALEELPNPDNQPSAYLGCGIELLRAFREEIKGGQ